MYNIIVPSVASPLRGAFPSHYLIKKFQENAGKEAYSMLYDLEKRDDYKEYKGKATPSLGWFILDFDIEIPSEYKSKKKEYFTSKETEASLLAEIEIVRKEVCQIISDLNLDEEMARVFFSGGKGFHLYIRQEYWNIPVDERIPEVHKARLVALQRTYKTLDSAVAETHRKIRAPNSRHPYSGLHKVCINFTQLAEWDISHIRDYAKEQRPFDLVNFDCGDKKYSGPVVSEKETPNSFSENKPESMHSFGMENVIHDVYEPNTIEPVKEKCAFIKWNFEHPEKVKNEQWIQAIGVVSRLADGRKLCHEMGNKHPEYTPKSTDFEVDRALKLTGPTLCKTIRAGGFEGCNTCTLKVTTPAAIRVYKHTEYDEETFDKENVTNESASNESFTSEEKENHKTESTIVCLGYDSGHYFFRSNINLQIQKLAASSLNQSGLTQLQPLKYWAARYAQIDKETGKPGRINWGKAANNLMQACHSKGIFRPDNIRGRGVWRDQDRTVYHMGRSLWVDGKIHPLHDPSFKTNYIYQLDREMKPLRMNDLDLDGCQKLIDVAAHIPFKNKSSYKMFAGWLAIAGIGGSLQWRPHFWVSGNTGSGKSYVIESIANRVLDGYCQYIRGNTTEAGLRQKCGSSSMPVIFDEFESNDPKSAARVQSLLELLRQASSESAGIVARGTVSGDAMEFRPQWAAMVGSVVVNLSKAEDENRFTVTEIIKTTDPLLRKSKFKELEKMVDELPSDYSDRLFARMLNKNEILRESIEVIKDEISSKFTARTAQQYSSLLAGYWMLEHDQVISEAHAAELVGSVDFNDAKESNDRKDEEDCFDHFMSSMHRIQVETDGRMSTLEISMAEMLTSDRYNEFKEPLERLGVAMEGDFLWVSVKNSSIDKAFAGTKWAGVYARSFKRLEACVDPRDTRYFFKRKVKTVKLSKSKLFK